jgi:acetyl esterase/lipase
MVIKSGKTSKATYRPKLSEGYEFFAFTSEDCSFLIDRLSNRSWLLGWFLLLMRRFFLHGRYLIFVTTCVVGVSVLALIFSRADTKPASSPSPSVVQYDVVFGLVAFGSGGNQPLHAEIAAPASTKKPLPAIIYIHGGGWIGGDYRQAPLQQIAAHGFFGASIEYRLSNVAKWPAQIADCKLAVRWLRANAAKYNVDPNRIGVWGDSAGGHLVACLGTMAGDKELDTDDGYPGVSSAVQAVVDFYGPTDFTDLGHYSPMAIQLTQGLFGVPYAENPALWKSGSPLFQVKAGDPPTLIVQGDSDTLVLPAQSKLFDAALTRAGVPHQLIMVKNAEHGFRPTSASGIHPSLAKIGDLVFTFFDENLGKP